MAVKKFVPKKFLKRPNNPTSFEPISIFVMAPGAIFVLAMLVAVMNRIKRKKGMKPAEVPDYTEEIEEAKAEAKNN